jgi:hypothetical protein
VSALNGHGSHRVQQNEAVVRPEAYIGSFFLSAFALWAVLDDMSPVRVDSTWTLLSLTIAWWSLGWVMKRLGAPMLGKAWLWGSGVFVGAFVGLALLLVFSGGI